MRQTGVSFSQSYIEETLTCYPDIAELLFTLFEQRLDPAGKQDAKVPSQDAKASAKLHEQLAAKLDQVANLDDDRIIPPLCGDDRRHPAHQLLPAGQGGQHQALHLLPSWPLQHHRHAAAAAEVRDLRLLPASGRVHLRWGKVARGGLRWSDRKEDFRTEVLGLVKAQQVKNTVIVPVGAKGGFYCKQMPAGAPRAVIQEEGKACYRLFIRGLLDVTDNIIGGEVIPPKSVVRHDEDDYYLVVAADKAPPPSPTSPTR